MSILPIMLACPPSPEELWVYRLENFATVLLMLLSTTLLLVATLSVALHAARSVQR